jgi:SUMO ligase MMS21 Smc5/6 complex component
MKIRAKKYAVFNFVNIRADEMLLSYNHGEGVGEDLTIHRIDFDNCAISIKPIVYHSLSSTYEKLF